MTLYRLSFFFIDQQPSSSSQLSHLHFAVLAKLFPWLQPMPRLHPLPYSLYSMLTPILLYILSFSIFPPFLQLASSKLILLEKLEKSQIVLYLRKYFVVIFLIFSFSTCIAFVIVFYAFFFSSSMYFSMTCSRIILLFVVKIIFSSCAFSAILGSTSTIFFFLALRCWIFLVPSSFKFLII